VAVRQFAEEARRWLLVFLGRLLAQWAWPQFGDLGRKLDAVVGELWPFGRGQVEHLHALAAQPDLVQQTGDLLDSAFCVDITFQVMAVAVQSAGHHHAVSAVLERIEHQEHVNLARAGQLDDADAFRVRQPHRAGQVSRAVSAIVARKRDDVGIKILRHGDLPHVLRIPHYVL
jgi:hypothetical protein